MTNPNELWDELEKLADPEEARKVEQARGRSNFAPPFLATTCDVADVQGPWEETLNNGSRRRVVSLWLEGLRDTELADGRDGKELANGTFELRVPLPEKAQANSGYYLMVESIRMLKPDAKSVVALKGVKGVRLEEGVHSYMARGFTVDEVNPDQDRNGAIVKDRDGRPGRWGEKKFDTYYYRVTRLGNAVAKEAVPFVLSDTLRDAALNFAAGKVARDFAKGVMQDEAVRAAMGPNDRTAFQALVISEQFLKDAISDGLLTVADDGTYERRTVGVA